MLNLLPLRPTRSALRVFGPRFYLVGPPDPISHIRPVIYEDAIPHQPQPPPSVLRHPYSLREFDSGQIAPEEQLWKLQRQQLDDFVQHFWFDSNSRFEAAKQAILDSLPVSCSELGKEQALSEFYKQWVKQEEDRLQHFTDEWRRRNTAGIVLAARVHYLQLVRTIHGMLSKVF